MRQFQRDNSIFLIRPRRRRQLLIALALAICCFVLTCFSPVISAKVELSDNLQLVDRGNELYRSNRFNEAIQIWQQVETNFAAEKDYLNQAMAASNLSLTYQQLGLWQEANSSIDRSLQLLKILDITPERQRIYAQSLDVRGQLKYKIGQSRSASEIWQESAKIYEIDGDRPRRNEALVNQSQALQDLGLYPRACKLLLNVLAWDDRECQIVDTDIISLKTKLINSQPDNLQKSQARGLRNLGKVLLVVGNLDSSELVLQTSLEIANKWNARQDLEKIYLNLANTERSLAKRAAIFQDKNKANKYLDLALNNYQKASLSDLPTIKIQALLDWLSLSIEMQQTEVAEKLLSPIRATLDRLLPSRSTFYSRINFAKNSIDLQTKDLTESISLLEETIEAAEILEDDRSQAYALGILGRLYEKIEEIDRAKTYTKQAIATSQSIEANDLAYQWQWQLGRLSVATDDRREAILAYSRSIESLQAIRSDLASLNADVQFDFRQRVEPIYREYADLLLQESNPSQATLQIARQTIEDLQLAELDNFFQEACTTAIPKQIDEVDPNTAVIYAIILPDRAFDRERLEIILSLPESPTKLRHYTTTVAKNAIEKTVSELQRSLITPLYEEAEILPLAQTVYNWLILPLATDLANSPNIDNLAFVLDGVLRNIPMAVLHDGKEYLIDKKYSIALTPGLQLLDPKPSIESNFNLLAAGLNQAVTSIDSGTTYNKLPNVAEELNKIQPQEKLLDETFTSANLQKQVDSASFSVVHIATHGKFSSIAENTFILAWDGEINADRLKNILQSKSKSQSPIELLVLSACETAKGDDRAALGLAGIAVRAGARSTLASLWLVRDDAIAILMSEFYQQLRENGATKAKALAIAQKTLRQREEFASPYFWGAFVLVGNWL